MRKYVFIFIASPCLFLAGPRLPAAETWRPSDFEMRGWNMAVSATNECSCIFSPIGFAVSMAMLGEATVDEHRAPIAEAIGSVNDFANTFSSVLEAYVNASASNSVSISFAPSIWSRQIAEMDIDYRHSLLRNFGAVSDRLTDVLPINAWTGAATDGRLPQIVTGINPATSMLLLNAIAFEGAWKNGFDKAQTRTENFRLGTNENVRIPFMHGTETVDRITNKDFTAIRLPFAEEGIFMIYMLPSTGTDLAKLRAEIGERISIDELKIKFRAGYGPGADVDTLPLRLSLPRMELRSRWNLMPIMSRLGVPSTGYTRLGLDVKVDGVVQAAYVKLTETGYSLTPGAVPPAPSAKDRTRTRNSGSTDYRHYHAKAPYAATGEFRLDRPFLFMVWDANTDTIILAGQFTGK